MAQAKIALRASESERNAWEQSAEASGLKLSAWLRRAANQTAELEGALVKEAEFTLTPGQLKTISAPTVEEVRDKMYPQKRRKCVHRLMPGTYCKSCGVTK